MIFVTIRRVWWAIVETRRLKTPCRLAAWGRYMKNVGIPIYCYHRQLLISPTSLSPVRTTTALCVKSLLHSHVAFMHSTAYECQFSFQNVGMVYGRYHRQLLISPTSLSPVRTTTALCPSYDHCQVPAPFTRCIHAFHCIRIPIQLPKC